MDWTSFLTGATIGALSILAGITVFAFFWMRPYLKAMHGHSIKIQQAEDGGARRPGPGRDPFDLLRRN